MQPLACNLQPLATHGGVGGCTRVHRAPATSLRPPVALTVAQATRVTARAATRVIIGWLPQSRRAACARVLAVYWLCTGMQTHMYCT